MIRGNIPAMPNPPVQLKDNELNQLQTFMKNLYDSLNETVYLLDHNDCVEKDHSSLIRAKQILLEIEQSSLFPYKPWCLETTYDFDKLIEDLMKEIEQ